MSQQIIKPADKEPGFTDLFDLEEIQKLQDVIAETFGFACLITTPDGTPITRPSRFFSLCSKIILETPIGRKNCMMLRPTENNLLADVTAIKCESCGRWHLIAPITLDDRPIALWKAGQVRDPETSDEQLLEYARQIGADPEEYKKCLADVKVMSQQELIKAGNLILEITRLLTRKADRNYRLQQLNAKIEKEKLLNRTLALCDRAFELANAGYWMLKLDEPDYYISNERSAAILGEPPTPGWRYSITDWLANIRSIDPEAASKAQKSLEGAIHQHEQRYDTVFPYRRPADGQIVWIRATANLIRDDDGNPVELDGVAQDITEQVLSEKALKDSQQRLDLAINGAWLGLWDWQSAPEKFTTNQIWYEMLGYLPGDLEKIYPDSFQRWAKLVHPDDFPRVWKDAQDHLAGITSIYRSEFRMQTRSGGWKWIMTTGKCVERDADGKGTRLIGFHIDIDEQKKTENALAKAKHEAETAAQIKSTFLANMSHEIRTPMNAIIGMSQLALQTDMTQQQRGYIEKVNIAAQNLLGIINDVLDFSKIEAGKMLIDETSFWLEDVLNNFAIVTSLKAEEKGIELIFDIAPEVPVGLIGDPLRLNQVLTNLGNNAIKFTDSGLIVIGIETVSVRNSSCELHFWVQDTGSGIAESEQNKLFSPFSQLDGSATRQSGGSGLGLVISKNLVEGMQGKIWLESELGKGSTFHFTAQFKLQHRYDRPRPSKRLLAGKRALLMAMNERERPIIERYLKHYGMYFDSIESCQKLPEQLISLATEGKFPDVFINCADTQSTGCIECATRIRNSEFATVPIIIVAGAYQLTRLLHSAEMLGINHVRILGRPLFPLNLQTAILESLELFYSASTTADQSAASPFTTPTGASILLVEDNEMNQDLAIELLTQAGMKVTLARNGQEALDILSAGQKFDGVLMDCQMPVLDGYSATRALRKMPGLEDLPVIAMTANAMQGDREKALDAGMNDHIAKPVEVSNLFNTLSHWISRREQPDQALSEAAQAKPAEKFSKLAGIETERAIANLLNNTELYMRLLTSFYNSYENFTEKYLACTNLEEATRYAHSLKSGAGNIGATSVQSLAEKLEQSCKSGVESAQQTELIENVARAIDFAREEIARLMPEPADTVITQAQTGAEQTGYHDILQKLQELLAENDSEAISLIEQNERLLQEALPETFSELEEAIRSYDFEEALHLLQTILREKL